LKDSEQWTVISYQWTVTRIYFCSSGFSRLR
jgi:hypothetical protein